MNDVLEISRRNMEQAREVIRETRLVEAWESVRAEVNLVGSLKTGLLMKRLDIDFHIYTDPFILSDSFTAISRLAGNSKIRSIEYINLLDTEEKCLEWHAHYLDGKDRMWQIDMIHLMKDSPYTGYFEKVADRIIDTLTPDTKLVILTIKNEMPAEEKVMGIEIYRAVLADGIRTFAEFMKWKEQNPVDGIVEWMP